MLSPKWDCGPQRVNSVVIVNCGRPVVLYVTAEPTHRGGWRAGEVRRGKIRGAGRGNIKLKAKMPPRPNSHGCVLAACEQETATRDFSAVSSPLRSRPATLVLACTLRAPFAPPLFVKIEVVACTAATHRQGGGTPTSTYFSYSSVPPILIIV